MWSVNLAGCSGRNTTSPTARSPSGPARADGCSVGLEVEDFDAAIADLKTAGIRFKMEPFPTPVCRMAFILDPDGNTICIHKRNVGHH